MLDAVVEMMWIFGVDTMMMRSSNELVRQRLQELFEMKIENVMVHDPAKAVSHTHFEGKKLILGGPLKGYLVVMGETLYFGPALDVKDAVNMAFGMQFRHCKDDVKRFMKLADSPVYIGEYEVKDKTTVISNQEKHSIVHVLDAKDGYGKPTKIVTTKKDEDVKEAFFKEKWLKSIAEHAKGHYNSYVDYYRITNKKQ